MINTVESIIAPSIFNGFIASHGNKGQIPNKEVKKRDWLSTPPTSGNYLGVLKEGVVQVDFDNEEDVKIAMKLVTKMNYKCNILQTTRGVHLYFLDDGTTKVCDSHYYCTIGLETDYGIGGEGNNRTVRLRTITEENTTPKDRVWLRKVDEMEKLPAEFRLISKKNPNLKHCDTRNSVLFPYIIALLKKGLTNDEIRKCYKIINENVFDIPIEQSEIDIITRDEAFEVELEKVFYDDNGKFKHNKLGTYIIDNYNTIKVDGKLYLYDKDANDYSCDDERFEEIIIDLLDGIMNAQLKEVKDYVYRKTRNMMKKAQARYIGFNNGVYDILTDGMMDYSPSFFIPNRIPYDYNPNAYDEDSDAFLDKISCNNPEIRTRILELLGYTLYRDNNLQKMFFLISTNKEEDNGSNGKSTYLKVLQQMVGDNNYSTVVLPQFSNSFKLAEMENVLMNICDDVTGTKISVNDGANCKALSGEGEITVDRKYGQPFTLKPSLKLILACNNLPITQDHTNGFRRRQEVIVFNAIIKDTDVDYNPNILDALTTDGAMEYFINLGVQNLKTLLKTKSFTKEDSCTRLKNDWLQSEDVVQDWIDEHGRENIYHEGMSDAFDIFGQFCIRYGLEQLQKGEFNKSMKSRHGFNTHSSTIKGKTVMKFCK